jgi:hypothetical protein
MPYNANIKIADLTLAINPGQYSQTFKKYGEFRRAIGGGIVDMDVNGKKLVININGVAQAQVEEIKKRCALNKRISFIDYVPISEKNQQTRAVYEDLGSETIDNETIYTYVPTYYIMIFDFVPEYSRNIMSYVISGEEL